MSDLRLRLRRQLGDPAALREGGGKDAAVRAEGGSASAGAGETESPGGRSAGADAGASQGAGGAGPTGSPRPDGAAAGSVLERLRRLHRTAPAPAARPMASRASADAAMDAVIVRPFRRTDPRRPVTLAPSVELAETARGGVSCLCGRTVLPPGTAHGGVLLDDVLRVSGPTAVVLTGDPDMASFDPTRALFFDLETSGLLGGGGNVAFLCGAASIDAAGAVEVRQFLLRDPDEEPAALVSMAALIDEARFLVSFNGRSFDRNVLADRLTMNRMDADRVLRMPHLDLLHPARRLFGGRGAPCSLSAIEERRLGVFRSEDEVRGAEVPERWFEFLRCGRMDLLRPVLDHNALDLLSLLALASDLARCVEAPGASLPDPSGLVAAARLLILRGEGERAEEVLRLLARGDADDPVVYGALGVWAEHLRRSGRHEEALPLWRRMMQAAGVADPEPWRAAAIALEWRLGRPGEALDIVERLLERAGQGTDPVRAPEFEDMGRRRERLRRRVAGQDAGGSATLPACPARGRA